MVSDNPETFADLDGHVREANPGTCGNHSCPPPPEDGISALDLEDAVFNQEVSEDEMQAEVNAFNQMQRQQAAQPTPAQDSATGRQPDGSYIAPTGPGSTADNMVNPQVMPPTLIGSGECVALTAFLTGVTENTTQWQRGAPVVNADGTINSAVKPGTAIATFDKNGHYPRGHVAKNSGTFLGPGKNAGPGSIRVLDQWNAHPEIGTPAKPPGARDISFYKDRTYNVSNNSSAYYVILVPR